MLINAVELSCFASFRKGNDIEAEHLRKFAFFGNFVIEQPKSTRDIVC